MSEPRYFMAALAHETNTFSPLPTTLSSFALGILHRPGDTSTRAAAEQMPGYGDSVRIGRARGIDVVIGGCAWAQPGGPLSKRDYETLRDEMLDQLRRSDPIDAVLLTLHGAMVSHGSLDCEGDLLTRVRDVIGPDTPLGVLLDLHGNVTSAMIDSGAIVIACKEYPHTDYPERAAEMLDILEGAVRRVGPMPRTVMHRVPMLGLFGTTEDPMRGFVRRLQELERLGGLLSISAMHGFPWADTADTGASILVVHRGDPAAEQRATEIAASLAGEMFALGTGAPFPRRPLEDALDEAIALVGSDGPVVVADTADNAGGGAAADSTFILRALIDREIANAAIGMLWDPQAAAIAAAAGVGATLQMRIGGKVGPMSGVPVDGMAEVLCIRSDASQRGLDGFQRDPLGLAVAIRLDGVDVVINSIRQQTFSPDCFTELGIDVARKSLVVVKSTQHFRAAFDRVAAATVYCDTPGSMHSDLALLPYLRITRPIWPLDPSAAVVPATSVRPAEIPSAGPMTDTRLP